MSAAKPMNARGDSSWHPFRDSPINYTDQPWPLDRRTCTQRLICRVHTYLPPLQASCLWQAHGDVNPWLQDSQFWHQVENDMETRVLTMCFFVCLYVESDRDREYAPQGDRGSAGGVQSQWTWSQQALGLWGRGRCLICCLLKTCFLFILWHCETSIYSCLFRLRGHTSTSKP